MERTIDGVVYIAKSEVLWIIDEEISYCKIMLDIEDISPLSEFGWVARERGLLTIKRRLDKNEER